MRPINPADFLLRQLREKWIVLEGVLNASNPEVLEQAIHECSEFEKELSFLSYDIERFDALEAIILDAFVGAFQEARRRANLRLSETTRNR